MFLSAFGRIQREFFIKILYKNCLLKYVPTITMQHYREQKVRSNGSLQYKIKFSLDKDFFCVIKLLFSNAIQQSWINNIMKILPVPWFSLNSLSSSFVLFHETLHLFSAVGITFRRIKSEIVLLWWNIQSFWILM